MKDIHTQEPTVRAFFATHTSTEVYTAPEMTKEMLLTIQDQILELLARSPVLVRVVDMDGLNAHRDLRGSTLSSTVGVPPAPKRLIVSPPISLTWVDALMLILWPGAP